MGKSVSEFSSWATSFAKYATVVTLFSSFAHLAKGQETFVQREPEHPHYQLIVSEDDEVCKPLTALYNEMLRDELSEMEKAKRDLFTTNFEMKEPERFAKIGFTEPPEKKIELPGPPGSIPKNHKASFSVFDLFNEGNPRILVSKATSNGAGFESSTIKVLKKGVDFRVVQDGLFSTDVAPDIVDQNSGYTGLIASEKDKTKKSWGYLLMKWPNFDKMYTLYSRHMQALSDHDEPPVPSLGWVLPAIDASHGPISEKFFVHDGQPYFILNAYHYLPSTKEESNILVYTLTTSSHDDICYINLPGQETHARQRAIGDKQ